MTSLQTIHNPVQQLFNNDNQSVSTDPPFIYLKSIQPKSVQFEHDQHQITVTQNLDKEFEILFTEQRKAVEAANIPLIDRMEPGTRLLFTVSSKPQQTKQVIRRRTSMATVGGKSKTVADQESVSFAHYVNQMKDPKKIEQIVQLLGERLKHLNQQDMDELTQILPKADKNLFFQFRDGLLSLNQLKARVNIKLGLADYKTLDDLIQEGVDPKVKENMEQTAEYIKTIHRKESLQDVTLKDILKREPWQANNQCLKSLFQKVPDTKLLKSKDAYKDLSPQQIEELLKKFEPLPDYQPRSDASK